MNQNQIPTPSTLTREGEKRFKSGIEFQKQLLELTRAIQTRLLQGLPSNYSRDPNTNLAEFFRAVAKEFARLQISSSDINLDQYHEDTRTEYLFQVLGDSLFLGDRAINENLDDISYRNFLIRVRNAYYGGSRKDNIEDAVSDILGLPVQLKEVYLRLRTENSGYTLKDTHRMFFDILMDQVTSSTAIASLLEDIKFFVDLIKPAHVIYDTRLIWSDEFRNKNGACKSSYITQNMEYEVYDTNRIYMVTYLASSIYKYDSGTPDPTWVEGIISTANHDTGVFYLTDNKILVYNSDTGFYIRETSGDRPVVPDGFVSGDTIYYHATKDSSSTSNVIDSTWEWQGTIDDIYQDEELISLMDGRIIVYNDSTYAYTRDGSGEYRISIDDLLPNHEVVFKAEKNINSFQFYQTPQEVQDNWFKQFDSAVQAKSTFQEYVKKNKDLPDGAEEGYDIVIIDGVATIKEYESKFYKKDDTKNYREITVDKYSLYIDDEFQKQFQIDEAARTLTQQEAKNVFINTYGYTGIQNPETEYRIDVARTGELIEDGSRAQIQAVDDQTELCDRRASCTLMPFYEDTRKYWPWPDLQLTSGFFTFYHEFPSVAVANITDDTGIIIQDTVDDDGLIIQDTVDFGIGPIDDGYDLPAWYYLSSDPNTYQMPLLPMLGPDGLPAEKTDLTVYVNGKLVEDAVETIDPWNGIVSLNFIPPFSTKVRIDYYYAKRYPDPTYYLRAIKGPDAHPENDLPGIFSVIDVGGVVRRLTWPYEVSDESLYGDDRDYQVDKFPILNQRGELATKDEVTVSVGSVVTQGTFQVTQIDTEEGNRGTTLLNLTADLMSVQDGDTIIVSYQNYLDNTLIYVIESVNLLSGTIRVPNILPELGVQYTCTIVNFQIVEDAVEDIRPLLGHVRVNFLPPLGVYIRFNYYHTYQVRNYLMLPDGRPTTETEWDYEGSQYTPDTVHSAKSSYSLLVDQNPSLADIPYWDWDTLLKIGYRYRAFNLSHSSVLNSESFVLNDYEKYGPRASFFNRPGSLNRYDLMFSGEYLNDTDKNVKLNDKYLLKDLTPETILNPDVPLFVDTFTDDTHHVRALYADEVDTYEADLDGGKDLKASFTIIDPDDSGIIDYNPICEYDTNRRVSLYSDLKTVEFPNDGYDAHLTTIDDGGSSLPFRFHYIDQYYPNRELRINDYLDYVNQVPTEYRTGELRALRTSDIIKSPDGNFKALNVGDTLTIKNIPLLKANKITGEPETVLVDQDYVLVEIIDFETGRMHRPFEGTSGRYQYDLVRSKTYAVDVYLNEVQRLLILNGMIGYSYGLPVSVLQHFPGYGDTGINYPLNFPDPDPDPYPRNPDNPWIENPQSTYYPIPEYTIDGKTYKINRSLGVTGIVLTSQVIDAEGMAIGITGVDAGVTGPVGALDLGITGPVEYANPRTIDPYDVYQIPSGDTGIYISYSEAEYRVQWRNWDQDMMVVLMTPNGVISEDPINLMDDHGEGIKRSYWDVDDGQLREFRFSGSLIETSQRVYSSVAAADYPEGLIVLTQDQVDEIQASADPVVDLPELHLGDTDYELRRRIIRELQADNTFKVTEIQELVAL